MADKKQTLGEYIQVEMAKGVPVTIERKGMTDAEWEKVKKNARDSGKLVEDVSPPAASASPEDQKRIDGMTKRIEQNRRDQLDKPENKFDYLTPDMGGGSGGGGGGGGGPHEKTQVMPTVDLTGGRSPHEGAPGRADDAATQKALEDAVKNNESAAQMKDGLDFTTPESRLAAVVRDRNAQPPTDQSPVTDNADTTVSPTVTADPNVVVARKPMQFGNDAVSTAAASETQAPAPGEAPINFDQPLAPGTNPLDRILAPQTSAADNYVPGTSPDGGTVPPAPGTSTPPGPGVAASPQAPGGSGSAAVSLKTSTPGSGDTSQVSDPYAADRKLMEGAAQLHKDANTKLAETQLHEEQQKSKILNDKIAFTADNEQKRLAAVNAYDETLRHGEQTMNAISDERRALMNQKVDPDAYYTKGGIGRAIAATVSGALFGFVGQGPQFLQRMDNLAQQEVKNQQDELARKSGELGLIAGEKKNVIAMARERGMNAMQSIAAAKVSFYDSVQDQLAKAVADNPQFAEIAAQKNAEIEMAKSKESMLLTQATQVNAHANVKDRVELMNAQTQRMEMGVKMAAAAGGKGAQEMKPQQQERFAELRSVGDLLGNMWKDYTRLATSSVPGWSGTTSVLPQNVSDAARWNGPKATEYTQIIGKPIEGGVVREEDTKRYRENYIPNSTDVEGLAKEKVRTLIDMAAVKYKNEYETQRAAGVRGLDQLPTPAQYKADLEFKTFGSAALPGEKPYAP